MNIVSKSLLSIGMAAAVAVSASADEKHFHGPYAGADIGLTDSSEFYYGGHVGVRNQTDSNIVVGIEGSFGDYAVSKQFSSFTSKVDHSWAVLGYIGYAFGETGKNLIKVGAGYNEIKVSSSGGFFNPSHSSGDIRAFIGYERAISKKVNFRISTDYVEVVGTEGFQANAGFSFQF